MSSNKNLQNTYGIVLLLTLTPINPVHFICYIHAIDAQDN